MERVQGKAVRLQVSGRDLHGRTLATLYLDDLSINQWLVKEGHAWSSRYKHDRGRYVAEERMANALGRGFNRAGGAVMPEGFPARSRALPVRRSGANNGARRSRHRLRWLRRGPRRPQQPTPIAATAAPTAARCAPAPKRLSS